MNQREILCKLHADLEALQQELKQVREQLRLAMLLLQNQETAVFFTQSLIEKLIPDDEEEVSA